MPASSKPSHSTLLSMARDLVAALEASAPVSRKKPEVSSSEGETKPVSRKKRTPKVPEPVPPS